MEKVRKLIVEVGFSIVRVNSNELVELGRDVGLMPEFWPYLGNMEVYEVGVICLDFH